MKEALSNFLGIVLLGIALLAAMEIPAFIHSLHCDGCDWFWCNSFQSK